MAQQDALVQELYAGAWPNTTSTVILSPTGSNNQRFLVKYVRAVNSSPNVQTAILYKIKSGQSPQYWNVIDKVYLDPNDPPYHNGEAFVMENGDQLVGVTNDANMVSLFIGGAILTEPS